MNIDKELFVKFHDFLASEFGCDVAYNLDTRDIVCVFGAMIKAYNQGKEDAIR